VHLAVSNCSLAPLCVYFAERWHYNPLKFSRQEAPCLFLEKSWGRGPANFNRAEEGRDSPANAPDRCDSWELIRLHSTTPPPASLTTSQDWILKAPQCRQRPRSGAGRNLPFPLQNRIRVKSGSANIYATVHRPSRPARHFPPHSHSIPRRPKETSPPSRSHPLLEAYAATPFPDAHLKSESRVLPIQSRTPAPSASKP